ncbi:MAG: TOBE domain-containing protein [Sulfurospirillum sp.]|nr:TOBE domain-containing protein [Sulfurospirillum sp.]
MQLSARNMLKGVVKNLEIGAVNVEVTIELAPEIVITSIITKHSYENLALVVGKEAFVVVKASDVMIGVS